MALASALRRLTEDEELRTRLGAAARHRAAALPTWEQTAERSFAAVSEAIGRPGRAGPATVGQDAPQVRSGKTEPNELGFQHLRRFERRKAWSAGPSGAVRSLIGPASPGPAESSSGFPTTPTTADASCCPFRRSPGTS
jgi:hypothetical protein